MSPGGAVGANTVCTNAMNASRFTTPFSTIAHRTPLMSFGRDEGRCVPLPVRDLFNQTLTAHRQALPPPAPGGVFGFSLPRSVTLMRFAPLL